MQAILLSDKNTQFTALLGDLQHKQDVYLLFADFGPHIDRYFSNSSQASFLRSYFPELVPEPSQPGQIPSDHTLGSVFEFNYYTSLPFRFKYLEVLQSRK